MLTDALPPEQRFSLGAHWYALRTKPRSESTVWRQAQALGVETFYPRLRSRPVNPRARKIKPYFPGYLFVRANLHETGLSTFQYMPYAHGVVCFGGEPAHVPDALIHAIRRRVEEFAERDEGWCDGCKPNDPIWIHDGPFAGHEAILDARLPGSDRVRVLLQMLSGRSVRVELDAAQIGHKQRS
jgi:transcriptional antiterminator RfaH